jgi:hypothetical protein
MAYHAIYTIRTKKPKIVASAEIELMHRDPINSARSLSQHDITAFSLFPSVIQFSTSTYPFLGFKAYIDEVSSVL